MIYLLCARAQFELRMWFMGITIRKISELSGISRGTVDRVLNNRTGVKPEIRAKVLKIASDLNYTPNAAAKALAYQKNPVCFGIIMPQKSITFFNAVFNGIQTAFEELADLGVCFEVCHVSNLLPDETVDAIHSFTDKQVSGILISSLDDPAVQSAIDSGVEKGIPFITFNSDISNCKRLCYVGQNLYKSGQVAARLLLRLVQSNSTVIIVTGNMKFLAHKARVEGFIDRINELDKSIRILEIIESYDDYNKTYKSLSATLKKHKKIDGIYMATGHNGACIEIVKTHSQSKKMKVICNDLLPEVIAGMNENIVDFSIVQDPFIQGYKSVKLLYDYVFLEKKPDEYNYTEISIKLPESL